MSHGGTPLFLTTATRDGDGAQFLVGVNWWGTIHEGQFVPGSNVKTNFVGVLTADMFPTVGTILRLGNGSYFKCTSKTENVGFGLKYPGTVVDMYTYKNVRIGRTQMFNEYFDYNATSGRYRSAMCQNWSPSAYTITNNTISDNDNSAVTDYDTFLMAMQDGNSRVETVTPTGIFYWTGETPAPDVWNYNYLIANNASYGIASASTKSYLFDFWAPNDTNPDFREEIYAGDYQGDISTPNVPEANYPDKYYSDNTDFTDTNTLISVSDMGAIHLYSPTFGQMNDFHNYLWSADFLQNWDAQLKKLFGSPEQQIIALLAIYADIPLNSSTASIVLGNISSEVQSATIAKQYITIDCGEVDVPRIWGNFLDFEPYTTISIYLPFISTVDLTANEIVGKKLQLKYNIDVLTGACVAQLRAIGEKRENVILNVSGNCGVQIPWNSANYNQLVSNGITAVAGLGATVLSGGLAPVIASGSIANAVGELAQIGVDTADNVFTGASPRFSRGGSFNTNNGVLCDKIPHLLITRPIQSFAQNYNKYNGYPSNITEKIGKLKGFTKIDKINLSGISATAEEIEQITTLLKSGIIIT